MPSKIQSPSLIKSELKKMETKEKKLKSELKKVSTKIKSLKMELKKNMTGGEKISLFVPNNLVFNDLKYALFLNYLFLESIGGFKEGEIFKIIKNLSIEIYKKIYNNKITPNGTRVIPNGNIKRLKSNTSDFKRKFPIPKNVVNIIKVNLNKLSKNNNNIDYNIKEIILTGENNSITFVLNDENTLIINNIDNLFNDFCKKYGYPSTNISTLKNKLQTIFEDKKNIHNNQKNLFEGLNPFGTNLHIDLNDYSSQNNLENKSLKRPKIINT